MKELTKYDGIEKRYHVSKKKLNMKAWICFLIIPAIILLILSAFCLKEAITLSDSKNQIQYQEIGKVDYKVYLKENQYYNEKFLPKGMKYIANLINTINVDFKYEMHATDNMDYRYKYKIQAKLVITDKNDNTKVLYEKPVVLLNETTKEVTDNHFIIDEDIDIDYDEYNNYVNAFKRDYALTVDSNLIITLDIMTEGNSDKIDETLDTTQALKISIPMSEQTLDIALDAKELNHQGMISGSDEFVIENPLLLVAGVTLSLTSIMMFGIAIYLYLSMRKTKDIYHTMVQKYLKEYDRVIVTSKQPNVDERLFDEVIRVVSIEELVDLHDMTGKPIIYYEVIPNEKSYFVIISDRLLYKLTITKAWLERNIVGKK